MSASPEPLLHAADANQARASDPSASAWVSANAGTGKTEVLVRRVLRLLLAGSEPQRILCLTYTKMAAAEMQNRLQNLAYQLQGRGIALDDRAQRRRGVRLGCLLADRRLPRSPRCPCTRASYCRGAVAGDQPSLRQRIRHR